MKSEIMKRIIITLSLIIFPINGYSWCSAPSEPYNSVPYKPSPPSKPYCLNSYNNSCDEWEIDNYNRQVRNYNSDLQDYQYEIERYVNELQNYVDKAMAYANCEIRNLD